MAGRKKRRKIKIVILIIEFIIIILFIFGLKYYKPHTYHLDLQEPNQEDVLSEQDEQIASITYKLPAGDLYILEYKDIVNLENVLTELEEKINIKGKQRTFYATNLGEVIVNGGNYGYVIDADAEIAQLKEDMELNKSVIREPIYKETEFSNVNNGLGENYIEIDVSRQHLWYYIDNELFLDTDCVTGKMTKDRYTPEGVYLLSYKQKNKVLRGEKDKYGNYEYESPVSYWMPFNGGIGLHDATWRKTFGDDIYINNGSHGCINLPYNKAKAIYEKIDKQTPIVVYYSEPYELTE